MKKSTKAVLLSLLVLPGAGHIFLKKYLTGFSLSILSLGGVYYILSKSLEKAYQIVDKIQTSGVQPDIASISSLISQQTSGAEGQLLNTITTTLFIFWVIGIVDSYRVGKTQDKING